MKPSPVMVMEQLALDPRARSLSLELFPGDAFAVMGRAQSGRRSFVSLLSGEGKPGAGRIVAVTPPILPRKREYGRRLTPQGVGKSLSKRGSSSRLTTVLSALGLWDVRQEPIVSLDPEQQAACDLLPVFLSEPGLAVIDGTIDQLDPWTREETMDLVDELRRAGGSFLVGTNLTTIAQRLGSVIVFNGMSPVYAGTVASLLKSLLPDEIIVETQDGSTVAAMVEPFSLQVKQSDGFVTIVSDKGQELAAKLLTEGYGQVRGIAIKEPSLADALRQLV